MGRRRGVKRRRPTPAMPEVRAGAALARAIRARRRSRSGRARSARQAAGAMQVLEQRLGREHRVDRARRSRTWSVATCSRPPGTSRSASCRTKGGWISRRRWWRFFGHGSGKLIQKACSEAGRAADPPTICSAVPCTSRTLRSSRAREPPRQLEHALARVLDAEEAPPAASRCARSSSNSPRPKPDPTHEPQRRREVGREEPWPSPSPSRSSAATPEVRARECRSLSARHHRV